MASRNQGYCCIPETDTAFYETLKRNEILITMVKGFHDLLVSSEGADVAASLPPHPWDSGGQTKLCFLHCICGIPHPTPTAPNTAGCYMLWLLHVVIPFPAHISHPAQMPPCNCLQWSSDINVHKNLGYLLKMQILCLPTENPTQYCCKSGRA